MEISCFAKGALTVVGIWLLLGLLVGLVFGHFCYTDTGGNNGRIE